MRYTLLCIFLHLILLTHSLGVQYDICTYKACIDDGHYICAMVP